MTTEPLGNPPKFTPDELDTLRRIVRLTRKHAAERLARRAAAESAAPLITPSERDAVGTALNAAFSLLVAERSRPAPEPAPTPPTQRNRAKRPAVPLNPPQRPTAPRKRPAVTP